MPIKLVNRFFSLQNLADMIVLGIVWEVIYLMRCFIPYLLRKYSLKVFYYNAQ